MRLQGLYIDEPFNPSTADPSATLAWMQPTETLRRRSRDVPLCDIKDALLFVDARAGCRTGILK
jgi:hypothetical protein